MNRLNGNLIRTAAVLAASFGMLGCFSPLAFAAEGRLASLNYNAGRLTIEAKGHVSRPQVDVQPGDSGEHTTAFLVLTFPHATADIASLQKIGDGILAAHSELQRFLVGAAANVAKATQASELQEGVEICLEFKLSSQTPLLSSNIVANPSGGWMITVKPTRNARVDASLPDQHAEDTVVKPFNAGKQPKTPQSALTPTETEALQSAQTALNRQKRKAEKPQNANISLDAIALNQSLTSVTADLQHVMNERDALESQVFRLKQQLAEQEHPTDLSKSAGNYIRPATILGEGPKVREVVTIQNLQLALGRVSNRLKATEAALAAQTEKTRQLASQVAYLTHDPAFLQDPSLVILPQEKLETASASQQEPPQTMLAIAPLAEGLPESAPDTINVSNWQDRDVSAIASLQTTTASTNVYKAPPRTAVVDPVSFKSRETQLKAAVKARPSDSKTVLQLADLYASVHDLNHAEQVLLQFLTVQPDYKPGYYALALVYVGEKKNVQAQSALDTYRRLNPGNKEAIRRLQESIWSITQLAPTTVKP